MCCRRLKDFEFAFQYDFNERRVPVSDAIVAYKGFQDVIIKLAPWVPMAEPKFRAGAKASAWERSVNWLTLSLMILQPQGLRIRLPVRLQRATRAGERRHRRLQGLSGFRAGAKASAWERSVNWLTLSLMS
jgi:hypothetical protein